MTQQNGRAFNEWLRAQLKVKKMSQRQLAQQSGVDHSTISRLIRGDRMPSLGTATKLARGLRELRDDTDTPQYLRMVSAGATNPTTRVEYALRADDWLTEAQVRQIMEYYLAVRIGRMGRPTQPQPASRQAPPWSAARARARCAHPPRPPSSQASPPAAPSVARSADPSAGRLARRATRPRTAHTLVRGSASRGPASRHPTTAAVDGPASCRTPRVGGFVCGASGRWLVPSRLGSRRHRSSARPRARSDSGCRGSSSSSGRRSGSARPSASERARSRLTLS